MPPKGSSSIWQDAPFLEDLALVMYEAAYQTGGLTPRVKTAVEEALRGHGHEVSWEAIRFDPATNLEREKMSRVTMRWGPEVHEDILLAFFQHINLGSADWARVMDTLRAKGYTFTENALRQHVQKLRKGRDLSAVASAVGGGGTPTATPTKSAARRKKTPQKRADKELSPVDDDEEVKNLKREAQDEEVKMETPKKKKVKKESA